jgi:hypothetical protein
MLNVDTTKDGARCFVVLLGKTYVFILVGEQEPNDAAHDAGCLRLLSLLCEETTGPLLVFEYVCVCNVLDAGGCALNNGTMVDWCRLIDWPLLSSRILPKRNRDKSRNGSSFLSFVVLDGLPDEGQSVVPRD